MNKNFFEKLVGQVVALNYQDAGKLAFANGVIAKLEDDFLVIEGKGFTLAVSYDKVTACRSKKGEENEVG